MSVVAPGLRLAPFAGLSASYFAHIGFFNPYLPLWLKHLGLPVVVISLLVATQSLTRVFAPYAWGALSDRSGERVRLLRLSAGVAVLASLGLWVSGGPAWIALVLLVMFSQTGSMMSLTEATMAQLVAGDWGRYGRIRLWGSVGFMVTVFLAGAWFERFGMGHFPGWTLLTLGLVLACTWWLPDVREAPAAARPDAAGVAQVLRQPAVRWFFASVFFHISSHFAIYGFISLYLDARGYAKGTIGLLWAVSVLAEILWFFSQGRWIGRISMAAWLVICGAGSGLRLLLLALAADWLLAVFVAQLLHALSFATHHTASIATITRHFPGRLGGRGQALFTVIGYGIGGVTGVLAGGLLVDRWGYQAMYLVAAAGAAGASACAWRARRLDAVR